MLRAATLVDLLALAAQHADRAEHRARVLRRRAAAAADEAHAALQHAAREHAEVLGVRDVQRAALDRGGQAGVRLRDHRLAAADHAGDDLIELRRPDAAVAADDIGARGDQAIRDLGGPEATVAAAVAVEHHHREHRDLRAALAATSIAFSISRIDVNVSSTIASTPASTSVSICSASANRASRRSAASRCRTSRRSGRPRRRRTRDRRPPSARARARRG